MKCCASRRSACSSQRSYGKGQGHTGTTSQTDVCVPLCRTCTRAPQILTHFARMTWSEHIIAHAYTWGAAHGVVYVVCARMHVRVCSCAHAHNHTLNLAGGVWCNVKLQKTYLFGACAVPPICLWIGLHHITGGTVSGCTCPTPS